MRKFIVLATIAVAAAVIAVPAFAATKTVKIGDIWFISKTGNHGKINVAKGTTVKWTWTGKFPHSVNATGPAKFHSKTQMKGSYSEKLTKPGTYKIFCKVHGAKAQSMTIVVK